MSEFADGKDEGALRTIGEVSDALGIKQHVLRYWEQQFPMLKPLKRSGGRRYYRPSDVQLVETIDRLVNTEGYTLKGAKAAIREGKGAASKPSLAEQAGSAISVAVSSGADDVLPQLKAIRSRLAAALEA
ncbi:putative HTH-type transcriptional regulator in himA 3'region [Altererythrobacter insulae]|nr:putative HTH-type transcriptional regulator in himA 3'region [Altererythrobacter insulae]